MIYFLILPLLFCVQTFADEGQSQEYKEFSQLLKKKVSLKKVKKIAESRGSTSLLNAATAAKKLPRGLGISRAEFLQAAFFIETRLPEYTAKKKYYLPKSKTGLSHTIEYDPQTKSCFIVLEGKRNQIGEGTKKIVSKAMCYNYKHKPKVVARAEEKIESNRELKISKVLHGKPGIFETLGFGQHRKHGKKYITVYSKIYNPGSLQAAFEKHTRFSLREKMKIALNILKGVESMHKEGIVHRDLGARNYLINIPKGKIGKRKIEACVADLGRADFITKVAGTKVQGNTKYTPPEALYLNKLKGKDYYAIDIYAAGCVFFRLFYEKWAPWQDRSYVKDTRSLHTRYDELVYRIKETTEIRKRYLANKQKKGALSSRHQFERLIMKMLSIDPKKRGTATSLRRKMEQILG